MDRLPIAQSLIQNLQDDLDQDMCKFEELKTELKDLRNKHQECMSNYAAELNKHDFLSKKMAIAEKENAEAANIVKQAKEKHYNWINAKKNIQEHYEWFMKDIKSELDYYKEYNGMELKIISESNNIYQIKYTFSFNNETPSDEYYVLCEYNENNETHKLLEMQPKLEYFHMLQKKLEVDNSISEMLHVARYLFKRLNEEAKS